MAAGNTYTSIATQTLGSAAASVTFSSIPSTYTDLVLVTSAYSASAAQNFQLQYNADTTSTYSYITCFGDGAGVYSYKPSNQSQLEYAGNSDTTSPTLCILNIQNYSNTTTYKTTLVRWNDPIRNAGMLVGLWRSTAAINSIKIMVSNSTVNMSAGSTFTLYGIAAA